MPLPPPIPLDSEAPEEELRRSKEHLLLALEAGRMGTWEWDVASSGVAWSPTLERIHGLEPGSFGGTFEDHQRDVHPEDRDRVLEAIQEAVRKRHDYRVEYRIVRPDGAVRWLEDRGRMILDEAGEPVRMAGVSSDVTERKRGEETVGFLLEASRVLGSSLDYETTLRNVADLVVPRLADWCAIDLLEAGGRLRRIATAHPDPQRRAWAEDYVAKHPPNPNSPHGVGRVLRTRETLLYPEDTDEDPRAGTRSEERFEVLRRVGMRSAILTPLEARGQVLGVLSLVSAESERRYSEDDLPAARELANVGALAVDNARLYQDAQEALRARDRILALVSHDLRDPLNSITLSAHLLFETHLPEEKRRRHAETIGRSAERASRLIQDLLDVARMEEGVFTVKHRRLDSLAVVSEAVEGFEAQAVERGVVLERELPGELPAIEGDLDRLAQVFSNLLRNALKVTPEGGRITVRAEAAGDGVRFAVEDTGPGIEPDELPHLFEPFWQGREEHRGSAGLGLGIARGIVEAHGGRLRADSEPGAGSVFSFTIPRA